jgi:quercetin dioxygenase-like cupin family protein
MMSVAFLALAALAGAARIETAAPPKVTVDTNLAARLPNVPGKRLTVITVTYPPGTSSRPHWHPRSAFVFAYVLSGRIESEVEGQPLRTFGRVKAGSKVQARITWSHEMQARTRRRGCSSSLSQIRLRS